MPEQSTILGDLIRQNAEYCHSQRIITGYELVEEFNRADGVDGAPDFTADRTEARSWSTCSAIHPRS
jgi:hypothetical protein